MSSTLTGSRTPSAPGWALAATSGIRAVFGVIWAINAALAWQPEFADHFVGYLHNAANGQPSWLEGWYNAWLAIVTPAAPVFILGTRLIETAIALGLLLGFARRWTAIVGLLFSLLLWVTAEGFGGPYVTGAANLGPALVYVLVFLALLFFEIMLGPTPYSVDYYIQRRWPAWQRFSDWRQVDLADHPLPQLPWRIQAVALAGLAAAILFLAGSFDSAMNVAPATPANAAAAVSPLNLASSNPSASAHDATLPPLLGTGDTVTLNLESSDKEVTIANGVTYQGWTFGGSVPGPVFHVRQGQTVNVAYTNKGQMQHSIDFHAAEVPPDIAYRNVNPGETIRFSFVAKTPGVFLYHCGTAPVLFHIANGMYGALIVDPVPALPPADLNYVLVQSEWYTRQLQGNQMTADYEKMKAGTPDEVVFNGVANQYKDNPLPARVGQRVRLYVVDAGPTLNSAFHVIGGMFAAVYPDGDPAHALNGVSTYPIAPGEGVVIDVMFDQPGEYPFVDHSMRSAFLGAVGVLQVAP